MTELLSPDTYLWGDWVVFVLANGEELVADDDFGLYHFPDDPQLRRCDFYLLRGGAPVARHDDRGRQEGDGRRRTTRIGDSRALVDARNFYGNRARLRPNSVGVPVAGWQRVATVYAIRYRRFGEDEGLYTHPYRFGQPLFGYEPDPGFAYRVRLPAGCILDDRGMVDP